MYVICSNVYIVNLIYIHMSIIIFNMYMCIGM